MNGRACYDRRRGYSRLYSTPRTQRTQRTKRQEFSLSFLCVLCVRCVGYTLMITRPLVIKFGGELLEDRAHLAGVVRALAAIVAAGAPVAVVHGGGKEIDAALKAAGLEKRQVDGLRITDEATLEVVVSVLAGAVNTRFVAALSAAGVAAVGLTGADGGCGLSDSAPPHRTVDGRLIDLGRVGIPSDRADTKLLTTLIGDGFVPVVASIGIGT